MCLATVYLKNANGQENICKNIADIRMENGEWVFTDLFGKSISVKSQLERINLLDNSVFLSEIKSTEA